MDIESLKTFLILSNTKNYTKTAEQMFVAQSTITNRINELEKELNTSLFLRTNRTVELTEEGVSFKSYAQKVIDLTNASLAEISSIQKYSHTLRIGCSDSIYESHLAPIILKHHKNCPTDALKITIGLSSHLIESLQDDIFDVVFTYLPLQKKAYRCTLYKEDSMVLVTDSRNPSYKKGIRKDDLIRENYLMCNYALQDVGQFIRDIFPKYHTFSMEIDDCSKIIPFLICEENDISSPDFRPSYTFLPLDIAAPYIETGKLRAIPLLDFKTPVINCYMICKKSKETICDAIFMK